MIRSDLFEHESSRFARIAIDDACSHNLDPSSLSLWAAVSSVSLLGTETPNLGFNSIKCQFEPSFSISLLPHPMIAVFIIFRNSPSFEEADHGERRRGRCENDLDFFFAFFCGLDLRAATDLARGQRWGAWKWLLLTFCGVRSNYYSYL